MCEGNCGARPNGEADQHGKKCEGKVVVHSPVQAKEEEYQPRRRRVAAALEIVSANANVVPAATSPNSKESKHVAAAAAHQAAEGQLLRKWKEMAKPKGKGAPPPAPTYVACKTEDKLLTWFQKRQLPLTRAPERDNDGWLVYNYTPVAPIIEAGPTWDSAYHGTWWYALQQVVDSGVLIESNDEKSGHEFWIGGVFCSPNIATARRYARPQVVLDNDVYLRAMLELKVDSARRRKKRKKGGVQWVFPSEAVALVGVWIQVNSPPEKGEERLEIWNESLEATPLRARRD